MNTDSSQLNMASVDRLKSFMRAILTVQKRKSDREEAHKAVQNKFAQIKKTVTGKKSFKKEVLNKHISELDRKVNDLLKKEAKLLRSSAFENKTIVELRSKINHMEQQIAAKDSERQSLMRLNKHKIEAMQEKIDSFINSKTQREQRMQELENRIKGTSVDSETQKRISLLEQKYNELLKKGEHEEEDLEKIKTRIDQLKLNI